MPPPQSTPPASLASRCVGSLRHEGRGRIVLLLGADATAPREEYVAAVQRAVDGDPALRGARITVRRITGLERSSAKVVPDAGGVWLQDRDRDVLGVIGLARYLSAAQLQALAFPGTHRTIALRRLRQLATARTGALLRVEYFVGATREHVRVWSLTHDGYVEAEKRASLPKTYSTDPVRPEFLQHLIWLNELFVALATSGGAPGHAGALPFRWICDTDHPLSFRTRGPGAVPVTASVAPDAILEIPPARLRVFIEAERGTHTIVPVSPSKTGATVAKLDRYTAFFGELTDLRTRSTPYADAFRDDLAPELLFVVRSELRRDRVRDAVLERRARDANPPPFGVQVLTMDEAAERYVGLLRRGHQRGTVPPAPSRSVHLTTKDLATVTTAFDALLRNVNAARTAGLGGLTAIELEAVSAARALLTKRF